MACGCGATLETPQSEWGSLNGVGMDVRGWWAEITRWGLEGPDISVFVDRLYGQETGREFVRICALQNGECVRGVVVGGIDRP
jgi:hypothetical protein